MGNALFSMSVCKIKNNILSSLKRRGEEAEEPGAYKKDLGLRFFGLPHNSTPSLHPDIRLLLLPSTPLNADNSNTVCSFSYKRE